MTWTSAQAYEAAMESGLISKRRKEVMTDLYVNGPATARMIFERTGLFAGSITPRLVELEAQGMVRRSGAERSGPLHTHNVVWEFAPGEVKPWRRETGPCDRKDCAEYRAALQRIADTPCDCGGVEMPPFQVHADGCAREHGAVRHATLILNLHPPKEDDE